MIVLILERVPVTLRGELSRWMIEPKTGVFVGQVSAMVRDRLWDMAVKGTKGGAALLLWSSPTEQGFLSRSFGPTARDLMDFEGLTLVHIPHGSQKGKRRKSADPAEDAIELPVSPEEPPPPA
jgi:CRISPR-associated protein Cas2